LDYSLVRKILEKEKVEIIYICGRLNDEIEKKIFELFNLKPMKKEAHNTSLSVNGINFISNSYDNVFFDLPEQSIMNLFLVGHVVNSVTQKNYTSFKDNSIYPFLLANISEGTSFYKIDSVDSFTRLGGSTMGITTYWSLVKLACGYEDPEEAVRDAINGRNEHVDLSVGDIYGGDYGEFGLDSRLVASAFGKVKKGSTEVKKEDISRSVLTFICISIIQLANYWAKNENLERVIIIGNPFQCLEFMQMMQMSINFFSGHKTKTYFTDFAPFINLIGLISKIN